MFVNVKINDSTVKAEMESSEMENIKLAVYGHLIDKLCEKFNDEKEGDEKLTDEELDILCDSVTTEYNLLPGNPLENFEMNFSEDILNDAVNTLIESLYENVISERAHIYRIEYSYEVYGTMYVKAKCEDDARDYVERCNDEMLEEYNTDIDNVEIDNVEMEDSYDDGYEDITDMY